MDAAQWFFFERLAVALGIGLLIGLERGWKQRLGEEGSRVAGLRTNGLAGLLGGIFGTFVEQSGALSFAVAFAAFAAVLMVFYRRASESGDDLSATGALANLSAFALGGLAGTGALQPAAAFAVLVTLLLAFKGALQGFLRRFTFEELRSLLLLLAMTAVALPLLPDRPLGPWAAVNPHEIWIVTIIIAAISSAGYVADKLIGPRWGPLASAALGGLVSSTAVTLSHSRLARRHPELRPALVAGILVAAAVMFLRVCAVAAVFRPDVALMLLIVSAGPVIVFGSGAVVVLRRAPAQELPAEPPVRNPFELPTVLLFGALLAVASILARSLEALLGSTGLYVSSVVAGFADVDAASLSVLRLVPAVVVDVAVVAVLLAAAADSIFKAMAAWWLGGRAVGVPVSVVSALALATAGAAAVLLL